MKKKFVEKDEEEFILKNADWFTKNVIQRKKGGRYGKLKK